MHLSSLIGTDCATLANNGDNNHHVIFIEQTTAVSESKGLRLSSFASYWTNPLVHEHQVLN